MTSEQITQELALGKHAISYAAGIATAVGILTQVDSDTLITSVDHIVNGVKEIAIGVGPLVALGMGLWARYNSSLAAKKAAVIAATPGTMVVQSSGSDRATVNLAAMIATIPEVHAVISTPEVAAATVSPKVVSP